MSASPDPPWAAAAFNAAAVAAFCVADDLRGLAAAAPPSVGGV